jgi:hypothetical protein
VWYETVSVSSYRYALIRLWLTLLFCLVASAARADITVMLHSEDMAGPVHVPGAVLSARPLDPSIGRDIRPPVLEMRQEGRLFRPFILPTQVGDPVAFPNRDPIAHHVYSFSQTKAFELPLYREEMPEPLVFEKAGVVPLGCNIHDWMLGYIVVVDTPFYTQMSGTHGVLRGLPPGEYEISLWHPSMDPRETLSKVIEVADEDRTETLVMRYPQNNIEQPTAPAKRLDESDDY